jgi:hypothetical protein
MIVIIFSAGQPIDPVAEVSLTFVMNGRRGIEANLHRRPRTPTKGIEWPSS